MAKGPSGILWKTLNELEHDWGSAPADASGLVSAVHSARNVILKDLSIEQLRVLVGQRIGLRWLTPIVLDALEDDPLIESNFFPGDLLSALLRNSAESMSLRRQNLLRLRAAVERAIELGGTIPSGEYTPPVEDDLRTEWSEWLASPGSQPGRPPRR